MAVPERAAWEEHSVWCDDQIRRMRRGNASGKTPEIAIQFPRRRTARSGFAAAASASTWARESRNSRVITADLGRVCPKASPSRSAAGPADLRRWSGACWPERSPGTPAGACSSGRLLDSMVLVSSPTVSRTYSLSTRVIEFQLLQLYSTRKSDCLDNVQRFSYLFD